jgi:hypothetical protein
MAYVANVQNPFHLLAPDLIVCVALRLPPAACLGFSEVLKSCRLFDEANAHFEPLLDALLVAKNRRPLSSEQEKQLRLGLNKNDWVCFAQPMFDVLTHQRYLRALEWIQHDVLSQVRSIAPTMEELASGLYHHGAVYLRSDMYERLEADESVQLLSVPSSKGRLLFLVSCSLYNLCDPGCFCAGQKAFTVQCYTPAPTTVTKVTTAPGAECLLGYAWPTGEAVSFPSEKNYAVWAPDANSIEDQFVGLQGSTQAPLTP